ncbi:hypothetical protein RJT34_13328 [Clitoria ternatea]|uniref:Very-long-chain 3-oxoacyl-CoA synthase n=1 Tax=Clitoria ternatea TaxID=43366 RepID=A0AAN9JNT5_CLITE
MYGGSSPLGLPTALYLPKLREFGLFRKHSSDDCFSLKSAYRMMLDQQYPISYLHGTGYLKIKIKNFTWIAGKTLGSSPHFLCFTILSYLFSFFILPLPPIPPSILKPISAVHNTFLLLLSFIMALGCILSSVSQAPHLHWIICFPPHTKPNGPLFFWAYVFYLSKILEFIDTFLIILSNSLQRLTFLHVYHHSTVLIVCYIWLTLFPVVLVTNASVHVLMYAYYLSCALGVRPKWKKVVTRVQITQFYSSFVVLGLMLYYHFTGSGCSGVWGWSFNVVFYASLLLLFVDFHKKNYSKKNIN